MVDSLLINSIYMATEGEGVRIGSPQIFVRTQGCTIGCVNCDSMETWDFTEDMRMSLTSIISQVEKLSGKYPYRIKSVSITGGDPLHPKHAPAVIELAKRLKHEGYYINLEASGSRMVDEVFDIVDFISFDVKTPSTGVRTSADFVKRLATQYPNKYQIKSVIADKHDFEFVFDLYTKTLADLKPNQINWVLTPCYEPHEAFPKERFEMILEKNLEFGAPFRVIGQQHKWIFGPEKKLV